MPDPGKLTTARLFVGLWPPDEVRGQLLKVGKQMHAALAGRLTRAETIHLTLAFIGNLDRARVPELVDGLAGIRMPGFELLFDQARCWNHNKIGYLSPSTSPQALFDLVCELEAALDRLSVPFDRRPYKPHITLIRKAECPKRIPAEGRDSVSPGWGDFVPIRWSAEDFVLVESVLSSSGAAYRVVARIPLS